MIRRSFCHNLCNELQDTSKDIFMSEEVKYWTSKPFVSFDAPDENGIRAEVKVIKGFAPVVGVEEKGKSSLVTFQVPGRQWATSGRAPSSSEVVKRAQEALENNEALYFRVEIHRKEEVDRTESILDLTGDSADDPDMKPIITKRNCFKSLGAVGEAEDKMIFNKFAKTNPAEDPGMNDPSSRNANNYTIEELRALSNPASSNSTSVAVGASSEFSDPEAGYAPTLGLSILSFVRTQVLEEGIGASTEDVYELSKMLAKAISLLQVKTFDLEKADLTAMSHKVCRDLIFDLIKFSFVLEEEIFVDKKARSAWGKKLLREAASEWAWSQELYSEMNETDED